MVVTVTGWGVPNYHEFCPVFGDFFACLSYVLKSFLLFPTAASPPVRDGHPPDEGDVAG